MNLRELIVPADERVDHVSVHLTALWRLGEGSGKSTAATVRSSRPRVTPRF
jgi:hypothetical protein